MGKKRILCFGDSMTWGFDPVTRERFSEDERWTGILQNLLGERATVIEEGQSGRTIASDDPAEGEKNGLKYVIPCVESQKPIDLMIIMLGSNDIKSKFGFCAMDIAGEMQILLEKVLAYNHFRMRDHMQILLISPPYLGENLENSWLGECFDLSIARKISMQLAGWYQQLADMYHLHFLDAAEFVTASSADSVHPDAEGQKKLAGVIFDKLTEVGLL